MDYLLLLLKNDDSGKIVQALKGTLKVDFSALPKEVKSLDTQYAQTSTKLQGLDSNSPTYAKDKEALTKQLSFIEKNITKLAIAKEGTPTDTSASISVMSSLLTKNITSAEGAVGYDDASGGSAIDPETNQQVFGQDALRVRNQAVKKSKSKFLQTLLKPDGTPLNSKAELIIMGSLENEYRDFLGKKDKTPAKSQEEIYKGIVDKTPNPVDFITKSLKNPNAVKNPENVFDNLVNIYKLDPAEATKLLDDGFRNLQNTKKQTYTAPTKIKARIDPGFYTTDKEQAEMDAWDKQYGDTHNIDGTRK